MRIATLFLALSCLVSAPALACMNTMEEDRLVSAKPSKPHKARAKQNEAPSDPSPVQAKADPKAEQTTVGVPQTEPESPTVADANAATVVAAPPERIATYVDQSAPERLASAPLVPALGLLCAGMLGTAAFLSARARADKARWEAIAE